MHDVTLILSSIEQGDPRAAEQLLPLVYEELRKLAAQRLAQEKPGQTLQATALVHEAYIRLVASSANSGRKSGLSPPANAGGSPSWDSRRHFFAAAAEAMRRILIDRARSKQSAKRGGALQRVPLDQGATLVAPEGTPGEDLLALDEALQQLEAEDPVKARLVKLRFFAGVSLEDAARMLDVSPATAKRYWVYARSWLYGKLRGD
jgi:RNA polymerase sigma factor (sigma-70 family)